jgi:hypothetical protein
MILLLAVGLGMFVLTLCVQMAPIALLIHLVTSRHKHGLIRPSFGANIVVLQLLAALVLLAHLVNIALWALLFWLCGEFAEFEVAYYYSAVNYSSLGYGDIVMSPRWRLLGPLETIDGIVMFGVSTALIFALIMRLIERRLKANEPALDSMSQSSGGRK